MDDKTFHFLLSGQHDDISFFDAGNEDHYIKGHFVLKNYAILITSKDLRELTTDTLSDGWMFRKVYILLKS
ncbi:hypothetical protein [Sporosarcina sp. NPDC096371]|uniref:hypothetical protein n=1 Tax=Sporosarcina sp. NPDC096371 TaxID=3364530 RepID=UPI003830B5FF